MPIKPKLFAFSHICGTSYVTGAEKALLFLMSELQPFFDITLVVPNTGFMSERATEKGIPIIQLSIPLTDFIYLAKPDIDDELQKLKSTESYGWLLQLLANDRPEAVLVNTAVHPLPAMAAKEQGIPVVWSITETIRKTPHTAAAAAVINQFSDWIAGISETAVEPLRNDSVAAHGRVHVLPPSWYPEQLRPDEWEVNRQSRRQQLGIEARHTLVGFIVSAIYDSKGYIPFMDMAAELSSRHANAMFLVVGNPVDKSLYEEGKEIVRRRGYSERVRWVRFEEQIATLYPALDLLVVPSLIPEGFGLTALEGLMFGKPVVAFGSGGLKEIMEQTGNADNAVPAGDLAGLVERVHRFLQNEDARTAAGEHNRRAVERVYGLDAYRQRLQKLLDVLLAAIPERKDSDAGLNVINRKPRRGRKRAGRRNKTRPSRKRSGAKRQRKRSGGRRYGARRSRRHRKMAKRAR
ncbi:glycosyltransferase [Paenibacillus sp. NPDC058071]|uniref:glycosyltransferase n=1 Tax=Paenibacillus sp. NPDC058071 TaxID=3346326 RepID=UPI0036D8076C